MEKMSNLIDRQAAIDAIGKASDELYENIKKGATFPQRQWFDGMAQAQSILEDLPSAQPEPCVNTIDELNESIKHFDDMAEECRRNANIERNDYMDMRDDAAEYRQLSIWLNELKWLRERFQSQPEIVRCKECKYRDADDFCTGRGYPNMLVPDDGFCDKGERSEE